MNTQIIQNNQSNEGPNTDLSINTFVITLKDKQKYIQSDNYKSLKTITNKIIHSPIIIRIIFKVKIPIDRFN